MNDGRISLGVINTRLIARPDWLSPRLSEHYLDLSTCFDSVSPDTLPLDKPGSVAFARAELLVELGLDAGRANQLQLELSLPELHFHPSPQGSVLGHVVLGFEWGGFGWHSQHCHNFADSAEGQSVEFNALGLLSRVEDAAHLADWYNSDESGSEPVSWVALYVHSVEPDAGCPSAIVPQS